MAPRIAIAGFQHETNSFATTETAFEDFRKADSWPEMLSGIDVLQGTKGMNLPIAGFADAALKDGAILLPVLWCAAEPSGPVTDEAFERISGRILDGIRSYGTVDGLYLDLHGAMITQGHDDGEGEFLSRLRDLVGFDRPLAISLDMHANVSAQIVALADEICIFRTYPHLDMARTGARAWVGLKRLLSGRVHAKTFRQAPFLIPLHAQHTRTDPARKLYAGLPDGPDGHVEMALGFTAGDVADCGPSVVAFATTKCDADALADRAFERLCAARTTFDMTLLSPSEAVAEAMAYSGTAPVVLADVQDNPGAGATSDTTGLLRTLVEAQAQDVLMGLLHDPLLADAAHRAGLGTDITGALGGRSGIAGESPFRSGFRVVALSAGEVQYTGEMYGGGTGRLGPSCAVQVLDTAADIRIVVTSVRNQCLDLAHFTHFGLSPSTARIICVKSTAHFRADFAPIASRIIPVAAPGLFACDLSRIPYGKLRRGMGTRMFPPPSGILPSPSGPGLH